MAAKKTAEFMIVNRRSKKALQATGLENGQVVEQAAPTGSDFQLWTAVSAGDSVKLINKATGKALDVMEGGTDNGAWIQTWDNVDGESQLWQDVKLTATYRKLKHQMSGKVLDIVDMSDSDGAPAQIWEDVNGEGQQWKFVTPTAGTEKKPAAKKAAPKAAAKKAAAPKTEKKAPAAEKPAPVVKAAVKKADPKTTAKTAEKKAPAAKAKKAAKKK